MGSGRGLEQLGQEQRAFLKPLAYPIQCGHQMGIDHFQRVGGFQQAAGCRGGLGFQALFHRLFQADLARLCGGSGRGGIGVAGNIGSAARIDAESTR